VEEEIFTVKNGPITERPTEQSPGKNRYLLSVHVQTILYSGPTTSAKENKSRQSITIVTVAKTTGNGLLEAPN
jgi:hypothetical protein